MLNEPENMETETDTDTETDTETNRKITVAEVSVVTQGGTFLDVSSG